MSLKTLFIYFSNHIPFFCFFEGGIDTSPRLIDRMGQAMARPFLTLAMLMPGTPVVYYGDEIGMRGHNSSQKDQGQRNLPMRTPMQWDATENAGFCSCSTGSPWMPINPTSTTVNVEVTTFGQTEQLVDYLPCLGQRLRLQSCYKMSALTAVLPSV